MAAGKWKMYESAKLAKSNGEIDFGSDAFKVNLYLSTSNADTLALATITQLTDITNQVATAFGYTQDTEVVAITSANAAGTITIDGDNPVWNASGGDIVARFAVIYDDTNALNLPCFVCLLDTAPANVTAADGNPLTITMNASGIITESGADSN